MSRERAAILVVEDDEAMRDLLSEELSDAGYEVDSAGGAAAGLELMRVQRFDLIITDLRMPEMDGFDLIRGVMALPDPPPLVMITAFGSIETAIRAVKLGAYDYITKPFEMEELLLVADKALGALEDAPLRQLMQSLAAGLGRARALVTSRFLLVDLDSWKGSGLAERRIDDLGPDSARELLRAWGVSGSDAVLDALAHESEAMRSRFPPGTRPRVGHSYRRP